MVEDHIIQDEVQLFVDKALESINFHKDCSDKRIESICEAMSLIVKEYTTEDYRFNLAMDYFVEAAYTNLSDCFARILDNADFNADNNDVNFAVFYALSLLRKKAGDVKGLKALLDDKYKSLSRYPLYYEVYSRYHKRVDEFKEALSWDKRVINILARNKTVNVALYVSYASTVCTMMMKDIDTLKNSDIELAEKYIDAAIKYNSKYGKYYFLKAKFVFLYALRNNGSVEALEEAAQEAIELIDEGADMARWDTYRYQNVFNEEDIKKYNEFKSYMEETIERKKNPRFVKSDSELDALKERILHSEDQNKCSSSYCLPPLPGSRVNDKYFFVCYSSTDYKSVYSDLIELYKHKVSFKYDEKLTHGVDWRSQVEKAIDDVNCIGVVFYLSRDMISRDAIYEEIGITTDRKKAYFCVNLEGNLLPSRMLIEWIVAQYEKDGATHVKGKNMEEFLRFFNDSQVFAHKFREDGPDGTNHIEAYIDALKVRFPELTIGD